MQEVVKFTLRLLIPVPSILKCFNLSLAVDPFWRLEEEVVVSFGVERRVQINQIDRLIFEMLTQDAKIVTVVQGVGHPRTLSPGSDWMQADNLKTISI